MAQGEVRASHILLKHRNSRRLASWKDEQGVEIRKRSPEDAAAVLEGFLAQIQAAADPAAEFANIAKAHSDCSSARAGGDLGAFGRGAMQKPFEDATYALKIGEMSEAVETDSGVHVILRTG